MSGVVYTSMDNGGSWSMREPDKDYILVIEPGAGTHHNRKAYEKLRNRGYILLILRAEGGYNTVYPEGWTDNSTLGRTGEANLANLAFQYEEAVGDKIPGLIICGSRGGQVTIGLVWRNFWRGPTMIINAGCLTSNTPIPMGVFPIMVTMGGDYFGTKDPDFVHKRFYELSAVDGMLFHILFDGHMPSLLGEYINDLVQLAITRNAQPDVWVDRFPSYVGHASPLIREPLNPGRRVRAIVQNANHERTWLRSSPTSVPKWQQNGGIPSSVVNGDVVLVMDMAHTDEDTNIHMYLVRGKAPSSTGWIFNRNLVPVGNGVRSLSPPGRYR
jgi:hypothetical protein